MCLCVDGVGAQDARTKGQSYRDMMRAQKSNPIWERTNLMVLHNYNRQCVHKRLGV